MIEDVLSARIEQHSPRDALEQENVLQELMQHYVLTSLARTGLFKAAAFHGGTFLRIVHGLERFSEDLDFVLKHPEPDFSWRDFAQRVVEDMEAEGIRFEAVDRSAADAAVKKAFLKTDSIGKLLELQLPFFRHPSRKIKIKLEIDTNPPAGSTFETHYIHFPVLVAVTTQTLESAFASKTHALLCRRYSKGRDWYDFLWFVARGTRPKLDLLQHAIEQVGPWAGQGVAVTPAWLTEQLAHAIARMDWRQTREDVRRFLPVGQQAGLDLWSTDLFLNHLERLATELGVSRG